MVKAWSIYLSLWLPIPLISVVLLTTFGRWGPIHRACRSVNGMKLRIGSNGRYLSLRAVCFGLSILVFGMTSRSSIDAQASVDEMPMGISSDGRSQLLSRKWRAERNFWISALIMTLWYVLGGLLRLLKENAELRSRLEEVKQLAEQEVPRESKKKA